MLTIDDLSVSYGKNNVLTNLSVSLEEGKIYGVVGYNGAGKTTLLNAIYGIPKMQNCIQYNGSVLRRSDVAYLDNEIFFYSGITGRDYVKMFQSKYSAFDFDKVGTFFNIPYDKFVGSYSTGMKKKLALVGVLSMGKRILLLDEPYNGLDMESVAVLQLVLKKMAGNGKIIVITSHIMETLSPVCDAIMLLKNGSISQQFAPWGYPVLAEMMRKDIEAEFGEAIAGSF